MYCVCECVESCKPETAGQGVGPVCRSIFSLSVFFERERSQILLDDVRQDKNKKMKVFDWCQIHPNNTSKSTIMSVVFVLVAVLVFHRDAWDRLYEMPCLLRNNYLLMEATRPLTECHMCQHVSGPIVLHNPSRREFEALAYSSKPLLVKGAASHWPAIEFFNVGFFRRLYDRVPGAYQSVDEECQFLPFKTEYTSLRQALHSPWLGNIDHSWYIGWSNCHPEIRKNLRSYYTHPNFLPTDSEYSALDWIFIGSPGPATTMHLDYVLRPSWQAQISGIKLWTLIPPPECETFCRGFNITVEKGDIVLVDTNTWYHATQVLPEGGLSIAIGSEYD